MTDRDMRQATVTGCDPAAKMLLRSRFVAIFTLSFVTFGLRGYLDAKGHKKRDLTSQLSVIAEMSYWLGQ